MGNAGKRNLSLGFYRTSLVLALLLGSDRLASAAATILSTGFGSPFGPGSIVDQFGWKTAGDGLGTAKILSAGGIPGAVLEVTRAANSDDRWAVPHLMGYPSQRYVAIDWDMKVNQTPSSAGFGPFLGVDTYDDTPFPAVLGSLGVDASTGDVLFQLQDSGNLQETGIQIAFGQWTHYRIVLDFLTDTYYGLVNGTVRASTGFVDRQFGLDNFTDADIAAFAAGSDEASQELSSTALFDNFVVRDGLLGDYDLDGDVDTGDYSRWRLSFGRNVSTPGFDADGNGNGVVDAADYVVWRNNVGQTLFSGTHTGAATGFASASAVVPEPASILLGLLSLITFAFQALCHRRAAARR